MSIWQKAYETYENHAHLAGVIRVEDRQPLTPVSHIVQRAQIEIALDASGKFLSASEVPKDKAKTIIPATEKSANRVGDNDNAHPLSDQLRYLCPIGGSKHEAYLSQLTQWSLSPFSHPKILSILHYIQGGTILDDLERSGLIQRSGSAIEKGKLAGTDYEKCMVRWRVHGLDAYPECWRDQSLFESFQNFYAGITEGATEQFCMITGTEARIAEMHPKGIVAAQYGAKLISANDSSGFTYRGRFTDEKQAITVSYEASQKAHNALQWLAANQGRMQGDRTFVCWNPKGKPVYQIFDPFLTEDETVTEPSDYVAALERTLQGYKNDLPDEEDVVIAAFDAATTGRLSVAYYNELRSSDYYDRVAAWYRSCCFPRRIYPGQPPVIQSPLLYWIVCFAFGTERSDRMEVDDRILKDQMPILVNCMIAQAHLPYPLVQALRNRASQPLAYNSKNRDQLLFSACSLIRKYYNDQKGQEEWTMTLDTNNKDRSYLFGRLLAFLEAAERSTYDRDEQREPNAIRMQSVYCDRPLHTATIIHGNLTPYFQRMRPGTRKYYRDQIGELFHLILNSDAPNLNQRLDDTYLLGYYLQRYDIYTKKNKEEEL